MTLSEEQFREFVRTTEPQLHRAFVAQLGWDRGREATAEALAYAWEHWDKVMATSNPAGYLFRVGKTRIRRRKSRAIFLREDDDDHWFEPALARALSALPERQRMAVILVHGYGWTSREVAEVTGVRVTTIQSHVERGLARLRSQLDVARSEHD